MKSTCNKKRVIFVVPLPPPYAGPEVSSHILVTSGLKERFDLIVLKSNLHARNADKGKVTLSSCFRFFRLLLSLLREILNQKTEVVYTLLSQNFSGFLRDSVIVLLVKLRGVRVVLHFRGSNFDAFYKRQPASFRLFIRAILGMADRIVLQAHWLKDVFEKFIDREKMSVVYNAVLPVPDEADYYRRSEEVVVLFMNHVSAAKGAALFLEAAEKIKARRPQTKFVIAGDVIAREKNIFITSDGISVPQIDIANILHRAQDRGIIDYVGYVSDKDKKQKLFREADIFVLPSYSEGCPMAVLEAMSAGLALVVTRVGALVELVKNGQNGFLVKIGDADELAVRIMDLVDDSDLRKKMSGINRNFVCSSLTPEKISSQIGDVLEAV